MSNRVQVIISDEDREAFRRQAERDGLSLSAWLREAGRRRLAEAAAPAIDTVEELRTFFRECADREGDSSEPDWPQHLEVIDSSRSRDRAPT